MRHGEPVQQGQACHQAQAGPEPFGLQPRPLEGLLRRRLVHQPNGQDRARDSGEQREGADGDDKGQEVEPQKAVMVRFVMDEGQAGQDRLEAAMRGVGADDQGQGALGGYRPDGRLGQAHDLLAEQAAGATRHDVRQGRGLFDPEAEVQHHLVEGDQQGHGGEDGQQGEEGHAADVEHHVAAPEAAEGAADHAEHLARTDASRVHRTHRQRHRPFCRRNQDWGRRYPLAAAWRKT